MFWTLHSYTVGPSNPDHGLEHEAQGLAFVGRLGFDNPKNQPKSGLPQSTPVGTHAQSTKYEHYSERASGVVFKRVGESVISSYRLRNCVGGPLEQPPGRPPGLGRGPHGDDGWAGVLLAKS